MSIIGASSVRDAVVELEITEEESKLPLMVLIMMADGKTREEAETVYNDNKETANVAAGFSGFGSVDVLKLGSTHIFRVAIHKT